MSAIFDDISALELLNYDLDIWKVSEDIVRSGSVDLVLDGVVPASTAFESPAGTLSKLLDDAVAGASGLMPPYGTAAQTLDAATLSAAGEKGIAPTWPLLGVEFTKVAEPDFLVLNPPRLNDEHDTFTDTAPYTRIAMAGRTAGAFSVSDNKGTIVNTSGQGTLLLLTDSSQEAPQGFYELQIDQIGGSGGYDNCSVGIIKDDSNWIVAMYDNRGYLGVFGSLAGWAGDVSTFANIGGRTTPFKIALSIVGNTFSAWVDTGGGYSCVSVGSPAAHYDFCADGNMSGWKVGIQSSCQNTSTWKFSNLKAGRFGTICMRDITIVLNEDGTPRMQDFNHVYFTCTACGPSSETYLGIYTINLLDFTIEQTGVVLISRGGGIKGDAAGHIVVGSGNQRVFTSGWGTYGTGGGVKIWYKNVTGIDLLNGFHTVSDPEEMALPGNTSGKVLYDPFVMFDSDHNGFLISYIVTDGSLLAGNNTYLAFTKDFSTFILRGIDYNHNWEGTRIFKDDDGTIYVMTGGPFQGGSSSSRVYNRDMNYLGALDCPFEGETNTPPPHPMVFSVGSTKVILTFDHTRYNGNFYTYGVPQVFTSGPIDLGLYSFPSDSLIKGQDSITHAFAAAWTVDISDSMSVPIDAFNPKLMEYTALAATLSDELKIPYDSAYALIVRSFAGAFSDTAKVIQDAISTGKFSLGSDSRWIAAVTITPRTSGVDPIHLSAYPIRHPVNYFEPRVKSYGTYTRAISAPVGFVKTGDGNLTVLDPDNSVRQRIAAKTILGSQADVRIGPEGGRFSTFYRPLLREVGAVSQPTDGELSFALQDSVSKYLDQSIPGLIDLTNFPLLPEESAGAFAPIIFGRVSANEHDTMVTSVGFWIPYYILSPSSYSTQGGVIKPILVKSASGDYRYLIARHLCGSVEIWRKKYDAKQFVIVPTDQYIRIQDTIASGETCEFVKFTSDQGDYELRANVKGLYYGSRYSFVGFHGEHSPNDYMKKIGLVIKDNSTGRLIKTELVGDYAGDNVYFEDTDIPAGCKIYSIRIWSGAELHIYDLQMGYIDEAGTITYGVRHGAHNSGGHLHEFIFIEGERLVSISGNHGLHIDSMTITTNIVSAEYGGNGGMVLYEIDVEQNFGTNFAEVMLSLLIDSLGYDANRINIPSFLDTATRVQDLLCAGAITEQITWGEAITRLQRSSNIDLFADKNDLLTAHYTTASDTLAGANPTSFVESFEDGLDLWDANSDPSYVIASTEWAHNGTHSLKTGAYMRDSVFLTKNIRSCSKLSFGVRTNFWGITDLSYIGWGHGVLPVAFISFNNVSGPQISICTNGADTLEIRRGDWTGPVLASITGLSLLFNTVKIEGACEIGTGGRVSLVINDTQTVEFIGNTQAQTDATITAIRLGGQGELFRWTHGYYDSFHYETVGASRVPINLSDNVRLYKGTVRQQLSDPTFNQIPYRYSLNNAGETWTEKTWNNAADQAALGSIVAEEPLQMYFVRDENTADAVVEKRGGYLSLDSFRFEAEIPLIPVIGELELADVVGIDHFGGIKVGGYVGELFKVTELSLDIDNLKYGVKGIKMIAP